MKNIHTLIPDIYDLMKRKDGWFTDEIKTAFANNLADRLQGQLSESRTKGTLRLSKMGPQCPRALWYSVHHPELAEPLPPWAEIKYCQGHMTEALTIALARAAGHTVTGEQDAVSVDGVLGHRDCVIDGCLVDVKRSYSRGMVKYKDGSIVDNDLFGYLDQLDGYLVGSADDPLVTVKDKGYILAVDSEKGHMVLYEHELRREQILKRIRDHKVIVGLREPPECTCKTEPDGQSGNIKLGLVASYNPYKYCCHPGLRTFIYSKGPVYLTRVMRKPDTIEVDKFGNRI